MQQEFAREFWSVSPEQWRLIAPHVPPKRIATRGGSQTTVEDRRCFEGMLWRLAHAARWNDIDTQRFASPHTCWRRFDEWKSLAALPAIWAAFLATVTPSDRRAWLVLHERTGFAPAQLKDRPPRAPRQRGHDGLIFEPALRTTP